ncbi:DUF1492 domain-containing protein [Bacteroides thetaiotaomicron]|nr:DUF1492 domain-containing protein [Bacteroides thetaiotaomicron]
MTSQEKKEQLLKYREAEKESERLEQEIARWYSKAEKMTTIIKMVPGGGDGGRSIETAIEEVDALAGELAESRRKAVRLRRSIGAAIEGINDAKLRQVLRLKYIDGIKSWEKVAEIMDISSRWVTSLHGKALSEIDVSSLQFPYFR